MLEEKTETTEDDMFLVGDDDTHEHKYLFFVLGNEVYGIAISHVTGIEELERIVPLPNMPEYIRGVVNLRGKVIPVMDLRLKFGMALREYDDRTCNIIVNIDGLTIGFIVDTVAEVEDIHPDKISTPPRFSTETDERYIAGLGRIGEEVKIILDVEKVVTGYDKETLIRAVRE